MQTPKPDFHSNHLSLSGQQLKKLNTMFGVNLSNGLEFDLNSEENSHLPLLLQKFFSFPIERVDFLNLKYQNLTLFFDILKELPSD